MAPYWLGYYQDFTRGSGWQDRAQELCWHQLREPATMGRLVLLTNFLDGTPDQRAVYDKYSLNPLINRNLLREWYELNKNGVSENGIQQRSTTMIRRPPATTTTSPNVSLPAMS